MMKATLFFPVCKIHRNCDCMFELTNDRVLGAGFALKSFVEIKPHTKYWKNHNTFCKINVMQTCWRLADRWLVYYVAIFTQKQFIQHAEASFTDFYSNKTSLKKRKGRNMTWVYATNIKLLTLKAYIISIVYK